MTSLDKNKFKNLDKENVGAHYLSCEQVKARRY